MTVFTQLVRDRPDALLRRVRSDVCRHLQTRPATRTDTVCRQTHVRNLLRLHDHRAH